MVSSDTMAANENFRPMFRRGMTEWSDDKPSKAIGVIYRSMNPTCLSEHARSDICGKRHELAVLAQNGANGNHQRFHLQTHGRQMRRFKNDLEGRRVNFSR